MKKFVEYWRINNTTKTNQQEKQQEYDGHFCSCRIEKMVEDNIWYPTNGRKHSSSCHIYSGHFITIPSIQVHFKIFLVLFMSHFTYRYQNTYLQLLKRYIFFLCHKSYQIKWVLVMGWLMILPWFKKMGVETRQFIVSLKIISFL